MSGIVVVSSRVGVLEELATAARTHGRAGEVVLIAPLAAGAEEGVTDAVRLIRLAARPESAARRRLERHVVGRTLLRLSPLDRGRQLARQVRRSPEARAALTTADALVAADRDATLSVWRAARTRPASIPAYFGLAAGIALIRRR